MRFSFLAVCFAIDQGWIREEGGAVVDDITVGLVHIGKDTRTHV